MTVPSGVRKIEFHTAIGPWKLISYIRKVTENPGVEHHVALKIEKGSRDFVSVEAIMKTEGRMFRNMIMENEITGNNVFFFFVSLVFHLV